MGEKVHMLIGSDAHVELIVFILVEKKGEGEV